jgi:hypothetical protein
MKLAALSKGIRRRNTFGGDPPILQQLAVEVVQRLEQTFGGADQLRLELHNKRSSKATISVHCPRSRFCPFDRVRRE